MQSHFTSQHPIPLSAFLWFIFLLIFWGSYFFSTDVAAYDLDPDISSIRPLPTDIKIDREKALLGKKLFHENRLSKDGTVSCATCHNLAKGGTDQRKKSIGVSGKPSEVNSPTVFNARYNFSQFWDGRAADLAEQIDGPIDHPDEMAIGWQGALSVLKSIPEYVEAFAAIYPEGITKNTVKDAIVEYEKTLITPNSRFDRFLRGEGALSGLERKGYDIFQSYGCIACHQGMNIGGNMYQYFGVMDDYFKDRGELSPKDYGRYNVTGNEADKFMFKVPSLRNVALTAPYFHDGSAETLEEAVDVMAEYQLGRTLTAEERKALIAFLNTLTGDYEPLE